MVHFSSSDDSAESIAPSRLAPRDARGPVSAGNLRTFTYESANRILPLVGQIAQDLLTTWRDLENEAAQIRGIQHLPHPTEIRIFTEELDCVKEAFRQQNERLSELQRELADLGVVVDSLEDGAFDFPASHNCRPVRLCWQIGEPQVMHWHGINESFCDRRKLEGVQGVPLDC